MELNKKIAEWCGIKKQLADKEHPLRLAWSYPDGTESGYLPHFTTSLDACFEYIYPKLFRELDAVKLLILLSQWVWDIVYGNDAPALALCKAVEKLIDRR